ncbi:MAG: Dabb family protein [Phycisphaerae bacterium]|nr:Dabb family protein [Tepidisphaeraceae bacterium]
MFIHTVYFWLKPGTPEAARDQLVRECREYLGKIESVRHLWAGVPAMTPREVVDNTYGVGLTVVLDDSAGHDHYQVAPLHKDFIERNKQHWERVQIYDHVE